MYAYEPTQDSLAALQRPHRLLVYYEQGQKLYCFFIPEGPLHNTHFSQSPGRFPSGRSGQSSLCLLAQTYPRLPDVACHRNNRSAGSENMDGIRLSLSDKNSRVLGVGLRGAISLPPSHTHTHTHTRARAMQICDNTDTYGFHCGDARNFHLS